MSKPEVTILVGESGSGKSTLAREMVDADPRKKTVPNPHLGEITWQSLNQQ